MARQLAGPNANRKHSKASTRPALEWHDDGSVTISNVPGWESHRLNFDVEVVNGETRVTSIRVLVGDDAVGSSRALSGLRMRSLPVQLMASLVADDNAARIQQTLAAIAETAAPKHDKRAITTVEQVAAAWNAARGQRARRQAVCDHLHIEPRTADRYLKRARAEGLLDDDENGEKDA